MAKAIKAAVIAAVVIFVVATTAGVGASFTAFGLTGASAMAAMTFATTLVSAGIGMMTSKGIEANNANFGSKASTKGALNPRQVVYGETRVGGTITFLRTTGTDNNRLSMFIVFAGHEIESFESINFNETTISTTNVTSSGAGSSNKIFTVTNSQYTNTDNAENFGSGRLVRFTLSDGSQTAINSLARATHGSTVIDNNFKLLGCAFMYVEMIYDSEKMPQIPKITAKIKGKKVYDPRLDTTVGGSGSHRLGTPSTYAWSDNPALCILDYLADTTHGLKATADELNLTANAGGFMSAANTCEQSVTISGITEERYTANGFTNMSANGTGILEGILSACGGKITFTNGKFNVFVAAAQTPSLTVTDDDLLSPVVISRNTQSNELFNSVKSIFVDKDNNYVGTDAPELTNATFLSEDTPSGESNTNYKKRLEVQLPYTQTALMAERLAKIALQHQRKTMQCSFLTSTKFLRLQPADFVYVTNDRMGWSQQMFEVISTQLEFVEQDEVPTAAVRLTLKEIDAATYDFVTNDYVTPITQGPVSEVPAGDYAITAPSGLAVSQILTLDGTTSKINIKATWTNNTTPYLFATEIAYKLSGEAAALNRSITVGAGTTTAYLPNVTVGEVYNVKARHVSSRGVYSAYTSAVNITIAAASAAPSNPSSASVSTGKPLNMIITYTNPNNSDLKAVKIYRRTINVAPTNDASSLVNTQYGSPNSISTWIDGQVNGLTAGTTYYYWIRAVNHSDVHSSFVAVGAGNFTTVASSEGITSNIDRPSFFYQSKTGNNNAPSNSEFSAIAGRNPIANDMIIVTNTTPNPDENKSYKYGGSSWSEVTNLITGDMVVDGTIGADQIVTAGLNADIIKAGTLEVARIPSTVVFTNEIDGTSGVTQTTISGGNITTGTINANNVAVTNITATNINAGTLNANRINLNGTTLTVTSNGLQVGTFDAVGHVNAGTLGAVISDQGTHTLTNQINISIERLTTPLTLTIPATKTAVAKAFIIRLMANPVGTAITSNAIFVQCGYATASNITTHNASPFFSSGVTDQTFANNYLQGIFAESVALSHKFTVTTSTSAATTVYIYGFAGIQGFSNPKIQYTLTVEGTFR